MAGTVKGGGDVEGKGKGEDEDEQVKIFASSHRLIFSAW